MKHTYKAVAVGLAKYENEPDPENMPHLIRSDELTNYTKSGWIVIGNVEVAVTFHTEEQIHAKRMDGLKAELETVRAENQRRENVILDQISKLQALTFVSA